MHQFEKIFARYTPLIRDPSGVKISALHSQWFRRQTVTLTPLHGGGEIENQTDVHTYTSKLSELGLPHTSPFFTRRVAFCHDASGY